MASAFGNHGPGHQPQDLTTSGMEVQEVTVYVNNEANVDTIEDKQNIGEGSRRPANPISSSNGNSNQGLLSVQKNPNASPNKDNGNNRKDSDNLGDAETPNSLGDQVFNNFYFMRVEITLIVCSNDYMFKYFMNNLLGRTKDFRLVSYIRLGNAILYTNQ